MDKTLPDNGTTTDEVFLVYGTRPKMDFGGLERFLGRTVGGGQYAVCFWDYKGPLQIKISAAKYTTAVDSVCGSWYLHVHKGSAPLRGVVRNIDEPRGAAITVPRTDQFCLCLLLYSSAPSHII